MGESMKPLYSVGTWVILEDGDFAIITEVIPIVSEDTPVVMSYKYKWVIPEQYGMAPEHSITGSWPKLNRWRRGSI
jgi:hypothetical protein